MVLGIAEPPWRASILSSLTSADLRCWAVRSTCDGCKIHAAEGRRGKTAARSDRVRRVMHKEWAEEVPTAYFKEFLL